MQTTLGSSAISLKQKDAQTSQLSQTWREVLGEPPHWGPNKVYKVLKVVPKIFNVPTP